MKSRQLTDILRLSFVRDVLLQKDGSPDKRMQSDHGFGGDHDRAVEAGKKGGATQEE